MESGLVKNAEDIDAGKGWWRAMIVPLNFGTIKGGPRRAAKSRESIGGQE